jgi:hypothetical protein
MPTEFDDFPEIQSPPEHFADFPELPSSSAVATAPPPSIPSAGLNLLQSGPSSLLPSQDMTPYAAPAGDPFGGHIPQYNRLLEGPELPTLADVTQQRTAAADNPALSAALDRRGEAGQRVDQWFNDNDALAQAIPTNPLARQGFNAAAAQQPFPVADLRMLDPALARAYGQRYQENYVRPLMEGAGRPTPDWNVGANLAERVGSGLAGLGPTSRRGRSTSATRTGR